MVRRKKALGIVALAAAFMLVLAACSSKTGGGGATPSTGGGATSTGPITKGGVYRTAVEDFGFTGAFDPTGEYLGSAFGLYSQLLLRNLVTYNHIGGVKGDAIVADLATDTGQVSSDGLTYTFKLKPGVKWGPPVNRAITSKDVAFAFQRIDSKPLVAQYDFYYDGTVVGMDGAVDKPADQISISGITTPDESTIVFKLAKPTGDFLYRLAMPAAAPIPPEVGKCFTKAGDYGRDLIASGPYMFQGSGDVDVSSCSAIKPMAGFDPTKFMKLVRNPSYDPSTDNAQDRHNYIDGVDLEINTNTDDIFNKIATGDYDGSFASVPPAQVLQKYVTDPTLKPFLHVDSGDRTLYIFMNLLTPPFDDIHVRKAVNYVINKAALLKAWGGSTSGQIATHIFPSTVLDFGSQSNYDPYPSPNHAGDLNAAKNEIKQSKYDSNGDGVCDAAACNDVLFINRSSGARVNMTPTIISNLASIGIKLKLRELDTSTAYTTVAVVKNLVPIAANAGWGKDYSDPYTFAVLFLKSGINCEGAINYSNVGISADLAKECGVSSQYDAAGGSSIPSVDAQSDQCQNLPVGQDRTNCWIDFDKNLMENVVPWVPYQWSNVLTVTGKSVTHYEFDQFSGILSLCHVAVSNKATIS